MNRDQEIPKETKEDQTRSKEIKRIKQKTAIDKQHQHYTKRDPCNGSHFDPASLPLATSLKSMSTPVTELRGDGEILKVGWYNSGLHAQTMEARLGLPKMQALTKDVRDAFIDHGLHALCLCELGKHLSGLQKVKDWEGNSQEEILNELLTAVD